MSWISVGIFIIVDSPFILIHLELDDIKRTQTAILEELKKIREDQK